MKVAKSLGYSDFVIGQLYWFLQDYQANAFGVGAPTDAVLEVSGPRPEDFEQIAHRYVPEYFAVVELFLTKAGVRANYSLLLAALPRWFRPEALKILEEQGVPIQISERFFSSGDAKPCGNSTFDATLLLELS